MGGETKNYAAVSPAILQMDQKRTNSAGKEIFGFLWRHYFNNRLKARNENGASGHGWISRKRFKPCQACRKETTAPSGMNEPRLALSKMTQEPLRCQTLFDMVSIFRPLPGLRFQTKAL